MKHFYLIFWMIFLGLGVTAQPVFNWSSSDFVANTNLQKMTVSGDEAVVAGFGRVFVKSTDNGATWNDIGILQPVYDFIDISFAGKNGYLVSTRPKLYDAFPKVYTDGVLLFSSDAGASWVNVPVDSLEAANDPALNPLAPSCFGMDFQAVGNADENVVLVFIRWMEYNTTAASGYSTHSGIFKSDDGGLSWRNLSGDLGSTVISTIVFSGNTCYIAGNKVLFKGDAGSDELTDIMANLNTSGNGYINDIQAVTDKELYLITVAHGIFKSTDGGESFEKMDVTGLTGGNDIYKVNDDILVVSGSSGRSRITVDGGTTWKDPGIATAIWEVGGVLNDTLYMLAKSDVYKHNVAELSGTSFNWVQQTLNPDNNIHKMEVFDSGEAVIIGFGTSIVYTDNNGASWSNLALPEVPVLDNLFDFNGLRNNGDTAVACLNRFLLTKAADGLPHDLYFQGGVFRTVDNWNTWNLIDVAQVGKDEGNDPSRNPQHPNCNGFNTSVIEYVGHGVILLWGRWYDISGEKKTEYNRVFRSTDSGKKWQAVTDDYGTLYVQDIKFRENTGYVAGNKLLLKSEDGGETFTDIYPVLKAAVNADPFINAITLGEGNEVFLTATAGVYRSPDGGATWAKVEGTTGGNDFWYFDNNSWVVMGTTAKSLFTNDGGQKWVSANPGATVWEVGVWNDNLYALAKGKLFRTPLEGLGINTSVEELQLQNDVTVLYTPYSVDLVSGEKSIERCAIWTVNGQLVRDFHPGAQRCSLPFNQFTPGIYITRVLSGGKLFVNKIVIP